jgi:hypothetical protein
MRVRSGNPTDKTETVDKIHLISGSHRHRKNDSEQKISETEFQKPLFLALISVLSKINTIFSF